MSRAHLIVQELIAQQRYGPKVDLFSLGCLLFELRLLASAFRSVVARFADGSKF